jgi:hypothetical protein
MDIGNFTLCSLGGLPDPLLDNLPAFRLDYIENIPANGRTRRICVKEVEKGPVRLLNSPVPVHEHRIR